MLILGWNGTKLQHRCYQRNAEGVNNDEMPTVYNIVSINNRVIDIVNFKNASIIVSSDRISSSVERKKLTESDKTLSKKHYI